MISSAKFWIQMAVFQVIFGLAVFAITRQFYMDDSASVSVDPPILRPMVPWPEGITKSDPAEFGSLTFSKLPLEDPGEISRQANALFADKQYSKAAQLYEQLLAFAPDNVDTYNNLGLTLHYLGQTTEALRRLNEGIAVNSKNQRIWLTLGFVNSQLGNADQARVALTTAIEMGADSTVGKSAAKMLESLP